MPRERVAGVVLAAGPSTRFGGQRPKQLARVEGETLVRRAAREALASELSQVIVVVGFEADAVRSAVAGLKVRVVENPDFTAGQSSSVKIGLAAIEDEAAAAIFLPVDQPWLAAATLDALIDCYRRTGGPIVVPVHRGRRGAPVLFDRRLFGELQAIEGDVGGRQLFARHSEEIVELELADPRAMQDVDTPDDLLHLND